MQQYRRRLPHLHAEGAPIFLNWRLHGTLARCHRDLLLTNGKAFAEEDRALDRATHGPTWLANPQIADVVAKAIQRGETDRHFYTLHAWVIMPNHIHTLLTPLVELPQITRWLKGSTAREANRILNRTGLPFWRDESFDRLVRDTAEFNRITRYIEFNPVSTGLVTSVEDWHWSSARQRAGGSACLTP